MLAGVSLYSVDPENAVTGEFFSVSFFLGASPSLLSVYSGRAKCAFVFRNFGYSGVRENESGFAVALSRR